MILQTLYPTDFSDIPSHAPTTVQVEFVKLEKRVFEKQQTRKGKKARQRVVVGKVKVAELSPPLRKPLLLKKLFGD